MRGFDQAFAVIVGHEGGYVNDPQDPGGETKFGISKRAYPLEDIAAMTLERAKTLYHRDYWQRLRGDELPPALALALFNFAVNSGVHAATQSLQRVIGVAVDGVIGPKTLEAIRRYGLKSTVIDLQAEHIVLMAALPKWPRYGRGWARRVVSIAVESLTGEEKSA